MTARRTWQFGRPPSERRLGSVLVALGATAATFALAFVSMESLPHFAARDAATAPVYVPLRAPAPVSPPRIQPRETPAPIRTPPATQQVAPAAPIAPPSTAPMAPPSQMRDTVAGGANSAANAPIGSAGASSAGKGASIAPTGINLDNRAANTPAVRDSIARQQMLGIPELARTRAPTGREKADADLTNAMVRSYQAELEESQRQALALRRRTTTAGNSADVLIHQGLGMGGAGAVGGPGVVSISAPLFSSGPSPAQRKKNEALFADYQSRLRRLDDRVLLKHDAVVADSVRADSLRRDAAQRDSLAAPRRP